VGVDHRGFDVLVTQELLDRPNIIAIFDQVGGERVPERVAARRPRDSDVAHRLLHGSLHHGLVQVMTPLDMRPRVVTPMVGREDPLPTFGRGIRFANGGQES